MTDAGDHGSTEYYVNRELSWFSFLERVLSEGVDPRYGAEERAKFLGIVSGSLDEFFAIRLSTLLRQKKEFPELKDICGFTAEEQIRLVLKRAGEFLGRADHVADSYVNYVEGLQKVHLYRTGGLKRQDNNLGIMLTKQDACDDVMSTSRDTADDVMSTVPNLINRIVPFDPAKIRSESVNIILKSRDGKSRFLLPIESPEERIVFAEGDKPGAGTAFLLEDILKDRGDLLPGDIDPSGICVFKAVRDRDEIYPGTPDQKNMANWLNDLETAGFVCCILQNTASEDTKAFLADTLALSRDAIFESKYVDLRFFSEILKYRPGIGSETGTETATGSLKDLKASQDFPLRERAANPFGAGAFNFLSKRDRLCCVPYDSFNEVLSFLGEAASDPDVISIRQTLYRTGRKSAVTDLLCRAAQNGKEVIVLMELRARYDEERNLENTKKLMASGAKVIFGRAGLKTHCKLLLVERKEQGGIRRYAHISTGNYNEFTAKTYTDVGLFTAATGICDDVLSLFEYASGYDNKPDLYSLTASPFGLKEEFLRLIERERFNAGNGKAAEITAKINSLCDRDIIDALLSAAASGVKVTLIVRGICCFKPSRPGLNDNLTVLSVVGKQLEHSRIFRFRNGGNTEYYCSSADWMPRNFEGRIEVLFPIWDKSAQRKLESVLNRLSEGSIDTMKLTPTGEYIPTSGKTGSAQEDLTGLIGGMD